VCERFGLRLPFVEPEWDDNTAWTISQLLTYEQIREYEEMELATIGVATKGPPA
jgi:hypothetical protein